MLSVCGSVSVCLQATNQDFTKFWACRRCNMLRTSGFVDDVIFSSNGPCGTGNATVVHTETDLPGDSTRLGAER